VNFAGMIGPISGALIAASIGIPGGLVAAGIVTIVAIPPGLALGGRARRLRAEVPEGRAAGGGGRDGEDELEAPVAL
jgi:hypothetical protein